MGMKRVYICDICKDKIDNPVDSFGVGFGADTTLTLGGYECTDGTHICYTCAKQLKKHLNNPEISKFLD